MRNGNTQRNIIYFITFFLYSGYYAGLAIIISFGLKSSSRFYSVPLRVLLTLLMLYIISKNLLKLNKKHRFRLVEIIFCFSILYIIKIIYTEFNSNNVFFLSRNWYEYIFYYISYSMLPFYTYASIDFRKYARTILNSLITSGFSLGVLCLYLYRNIISEGIGRISMIKYEDSNIETLSPLALSYAGALTIVMCLYKLIYVKHLARKEKLFLWLTIGLSFIMFFLGASRGSLIALIACLLALIYVGSKKHRMKLSILIILLIPLFLLGVQLTGSSILTRSESTIQAGDTNGRLILYKEAWNEFINHPFFGGRIEVSGIYPHNVFLESLMSTGFIGFLMFAFAVFICIKVIIVASRLSKDYVIPLLILILGLVQNMFSGSIYGAILMFAPMGIIYYVISHINLKYPQNGHLNKINISDNYDRRY